jgi:hypothetical protein
MEKKNARLTEAKPSAQQHVHFITRPRIHAAIVRLAVWGVLPVKLADWLIHRGGPGHV